MDWIDLIVSIASGLAVAIPLVFQLVKYVQKAVKEKNWSNLIELIMKYMKVAEDKFETGAEKKEWVLSMIEASSSTINYDIDLNLVNELIDSLCNMSKTVNTSEKEQNEG